MAEHKIHCPSCAQHLSVPEELAGQQIDCPSCNKPMTLPGDAFYETRRTSGSRNLANRLR